MFAPGQAYVAISCAKTWDSINLIGLDYSAFETDEGIVLEYEQLQLKYEQLVASFRA
jgi:hypothetical protein